MSIPYVVVLLRPIYLTNGAEPGADVLHLAAGSPEEAVIEAQREALEANDLPGRTPEDWKALAVFEGFEENRLPPRSPDRLLALTQMEQELAARLAFKCANEASTSGGATRANRLHRLLVPGEATNKGSALRLPDLEFRLLEELVRDPAHGPSEPNPTEEGKLAFQIFMKICGAPLAAK